MAVNVKQDWHEMDSVEVGGLLVRLVYEVVGVNERAEDIIEWATKYAIRCEDEVDSRAYERGFRQARDRYRVVPKGV